MPSNSELPARYEQRIEAGLPHELAASEELMEQLRTKNKFDEEKDKMTINYLKMIAFDWDTSSKMLHALASIDEESVKLNVAFNPSTSAETLVLLSEDESSTVRADIARNPNTPPDTLLKLAGDESLMVKEQVAANFRITKECIREICRENDWHVMASLAGNWHIPYATMVFLRNEEDPSVRQALAGNGKLFEKAPDMAFELSLDVYEEVRAELAGNPGLPKGHIMKKLATDNSNMVKYSLACNPRASIEVLDKLAEDPFTNVRMAVAGNPSTSPSALERLSEDEEQAVRYAVRENPATPQDIRNKLSLENAKYIIQDSHWMPQAGCESIGFEEWYEVEEFIESDPGFMERLENGYATIVEAPGEGVEEELLEGIPEPIPDLCVPGPSKAKEPHVPANDLRQAQSTAERIVTKPREARGKTPRS